ncbi:hypothetical protein THASP1DRAFT_22951 [Thamnocephalis sphaerospora]|uniref:Autophagy-related protein 11 n=1 Tax=Thamnocephalis sphaerospora TaxID=78915 RepID=A0A4V1IWY4_9FUNG|nr:hypothetical protein THASP1DRAFT_22951 [Thamnocephalis sphaerospora]|eukprot:RKP09169.1 hypothetical protein THASP1DRAFT_22951 [Thamnocephalis sphaerospora]
MQVYQAETGREITSPAFHALDSLAAFQDEIEALTGVPAADQIILTGAGEQLREEVLLLHTEKGAAAASTSHDTERDLVVLVYDRQLFAGGSSGEELVEMPALETVDSSDAPELLLARRQRARHGSAFARAAIVNTALGERLIAEQRVQAMALGVALKNLQMHVSSVMDAYDVFRGYAQKELTKRDNLLRSFQADMKALAHIRIHDALVATPSRLCLADYVAEEELRDCARKCLDGHEEVMHKVKEVAELVRSIQESNETEQQRALGIDFPSLDISMNEADECVRRLEHHAQVFERDYHRIKNMLNEILAAPPSLAGEKLTALDHLADIHANEYVHECERSDAYIRNVVARLVKAKITLTDEQLKRLQQVSHIQSSIAQLTPELGKLNVTIEAQAHGYSELLHAHRVPIAYGACLVEMVRRKEYSEMVVHVSRELAEAMAKIRAQEQRRRQNFSADVKQYIPFAITGLDEAPSVCEISAALGTSTLPVIDKADIATFEHELVRIKGQMTQETGGANDSPILSINKLHATMLKMISQIDGMNAEFERILGRAGGDKANANKSVGGSLHSNGSGEAEQSDSSARVELETQLRLNEALSERCAALERDLADARGQGSSNASSGPEVHLQQVEELQKKCAALEQSERELRTELAAQALQNDELREKCSALEQNIVAVRENAECDLQAERDEHSHLVDALEQKYVTLEQEHTDLQQKHAELEQILAATQTQAESDAQAALEKQTLLNQQLEEKCTTLECDLAEAHKRMEQAVQQTEQNKDAFNLERDAPLQLMAQLDQQLRDANTLTEELTAVQEKVSQVTLHLEHESKKTKEQQQELDAAQTQVGKLTQNITDMTEALDVWSRLLGHTHERDMEDSPTRENAEPQTLQEIMERFSVLVEAAAQTARDHHQDTFLRRHGGDVLKCPEELEAATTAASEAREQIEDWEIVCRLACEQLQKQQKGIRELAAIPGLDLTLTSPTNSSMSESLTSSMGDMMRSSERMHGERGEALAKYYQEVVQASVQMSLQDVVPVVRGKFELLGDECNRLRADKATLNASTAERLGLLARMSERLVFRDFQVGDLALFLPTRNPNAWAAFNIDAPHYFMTPIERYERHMRCNYIVYGEHSGTACAAAASAITNDPATNPYGLANGIQYHTIEARRWRPRSSSSTRRTRSVHISRGSIADVGELSMDMSMVVDSADTSLILDNLNVDGSGRGGAAGQALSSVIPDVHEEGQHVEEADPQRDSHQSA